MEKISSNQFLIFAWMFTLGSAILYVPNLLVEYSKQDAWISSLLAMLFCFILIGIYLLMFRLFPNKTVFQILECVFGKRFGKIIGLFIIISFHYLISVMTLRDFGDFLIVHILPETPLSVIHLIFLIVVAYSVKQGIEVIGRTSQILLPIPIFFYLLSAVLLLNKSDITHLLPIAADGWKPIVRASIANIGFPYLETFILVTLLPFVTPKTKISKPFCLGVLLGSLMLIIATVYSLMVLGVEYSENKIYTPYLLGAEINVANVIQRVEIIISSIWFVSMFIKMCLVVLATTIGLQQIFELRDYRILTLPLCLLLLPLSIMIMPNMSYWGILVDTWPFYASIQTMLIPIIIVIVGLIKKKR
ncbi:spore germination protein KB [Oikeobacillus pervagus]|uniref:Spore germination protein KB n=1 Tax=Oikeobacillus pervagus TaxID=1325931 RepID=A0AAJ1T0E2_9BACI|nr:endospore germination permease [Oikeobacillus pervagus]MDQ0216029.1 spore germination protein KB [Oikeobacillus pervagus]